MVTVRESPCAPAPAPAPRAVRIGGIGATVATLGAVVCAWVGSATASGRPSWADDVLLVVAVALFIAALVLVSVFAGGLVAWALRRHAVRAAHRDVAPTRPTDTAPATGDGAGPRVERSTSRRAPRAVPIGAVGAAAALVFGILWGITFTIVGVFAFGSDSEGTPDFPGWFWTVIFGPALAALWVALPAFLLTFVVGLGVWAWRRQRTPGSDVQAR